MSRGETRVEDGIDAHTYLLGVLQSWQDKNTCWNTIVPISVLIHTPYTCWKACYQGEHLAICEALHHFPDEYVHA